MHAPQTRPTPTPTPADGSAVAPDAFPALRSRPMPAHSAPTRPASAHIAPAATPPAAAPIPTPPDEAPVPVVRVLDLADRDATLARATGSVDARVQGWLVNDAVFALNMPPALQGSAREDRVCAAISAMCDIGPRDLIEGMLAAQMVAVHSAALECLRRAADPGAADRARDAGLRHAGRLLHLFQRQVRVRDDRRNPLLAHSLVGQRAADAPGRPPGARVALQRDPQSKVAPERDMNSAR